MDLILREADVMCVALRVANPGVLTRVQSALKAQGVSAEWYPRERLHCTLLTSDIPDDATAQAILRGMSLPLAFSTEGVRVEAWGDYLVLVLDPCPALPRIQTDIFNRALALGLEVSSYAPPGIYRPHITLGLYPRGSLDGLDGFPTDPLWFEDVVVWNGDYRQVDATRLPKEAGDRLFVEVSGVTRRLVARGGPGSGHFDHAGRPGEVGGSQPGDFHGAEDKAKGRVWWGEARDGAYAKAKEMRLNGQFAEVVGGPNPDNPDRPYEVITDRDIFIEEWGRERATDRNEAFSAITKTGLLALRDDGRRYLVGDNKRIVIPDDVFASIVKQGKRDQEIVVIHNHPPNDDDPSTMESPPSPTDIASVQYMHNVYGERKIGQGASLGFPVTGIVTTDRGTYRFTMNRSFSDSENQTAERFLEMGCERVPTPDQFAALSESERLVAQVSLYKNLDAAWRKVADAFPGVFTYRYEQRPE
jgi:2'-5' RNA ligase